MPKKTFYNLDKEKRTRVLDAALEEFGSHSFHRATVSRIVERADIPKGSFYQYFESKKDLYRHLIEMSQEKKFEFMKGALEEMESEDVFGRLRKLYRAGFRFAEQNPRLLAVGQNLMKEDAELQEELLEESLASGEDFIIGTLKEGVENDEIDPNANLSVAASMITQYNLKLVDIFLGTPLNEGAEEFLKKIDSMIDILKNGLSKE